MIINILNKILIDKFSYCMQEITELTIYFNFSWQNNLVTVSETTHTRHDTEDIVVDSINN